jgi:tetratricopeptide (TPR) repeat protein
MSLNAAIKKYGAAVGVVVAVLILGTALSGLGMNFAGSRASQDLRQDTSPPVATVGSRTITRAELDDRVEQMTRMQGAPRPEPHTLDTVRLSLIDQIAQEQALQVAAKDAGVTVSDSDLTEAREKAWTEQLRPSYAAKLGLPASASDRDIQAALAKEGTGIDLVNLKRAAMPDDRVRLTVTYQKLQQALRGKITADEAAARRALSDVTVRHILVKYGEGGVTEAAAKAKAEKLYAQVKADPKRMAELATQFTDDTGSKAKGGVYVWTPAQRARIVPEFAAALDTLKPGELAPAPVQHASGAPGDYSGFHIIRLETVIAGKDFPKDFDANKQKYIDTTVDQEASRKLGELIQATVPKVTVELSDPGIRAARSEREAGGKSGKERDAKLVDAIADLEKVAKAEDPTGSAALRKARIYETLKKNKEAAAAYEESLAASNNPVARISLAKLLIDLGDRAKATQQLEEAQQVPNDVSQTYQMADLYGKLGDKAKQRTLQEKGQAMFKRQLQMYQEQMKAQQAPTAPAPKASPATKK